MDPTRLGEIAHGVESYVLVIRDELNGYPETRWEEERTLALVESELQRMFPGNPVVKKTGGIWIDLDVTGATQRLLFRADVDALPVPAHGLAKSHACGHDTHVAMLLGFLRAVSQDRSILTSNLRVVFQRAEENPGTDPNPKSGGLTLVEEGVLDGVDQVYALHIWATGQPGVFYSRPGPFLGNSDRWWINVSTTGGHVAHPHHGMNALRITSAIQTALEGFPNRVLGPCQPATLEPTILTAGTASNIMPAAAELVYGVRTMLAPSDRDAYFDRLEAEVAAVVGRFPGSSVAFRRVLGHPALSNEPASFERVGELLASIGEQVLLHEPVLGGEDFAHYLLNRPGSMWLLGANQAGCGDHHTPAFNPDPRVFRRGVIFWLALAAS